MVDVNFWNRAQEWSPAVLRWGLSAVFLWFGINQLIDPYNYLGYLPTFLFTSPFGPTLIYINGIFEIIAGVLLAIGLFTRVSATLLALHLLIITYELGYGEVAVRDFGLAVATIAVALRGMDKWTIDYRMKKKKQ